MNKQSTAFKDFTMGTITGILAVIAFLAVVFFVPDQITGDAELVKSPDKQAKPVAQVNVKKPTVIENVPAPAASKEVTSVNIAQQGKQVYEATCFKCHKMGIVGAPKFADKDSWTPRIAKGIDTLFANALQGFQGETGVMPPKGGNTQLTDEDVKAAVAYLVSNK